MFDLEHNHIPEASQIFTGCWKWLFWILRLQKTQNLNGHPTLCIFSDDNFVTLQFFHLHTEQQLKLPFIYLTFFLQKFSTSHSITSHMTATSTVTTVWTTDSTHWTSSTTNEGTALTLLILCFMLSRDMHHSVPQCLHSRLQRITSGWH